MSKSKFNLKDIRKGDSVVLDLKEGGYNSTTRVVVDQITPSGGFLTAAGVTFDLAVWEIDDLIRTSLIPTEPGVYEIPDDGAAKLDEEGNWSFGGWGDWRPMRWVGDLDRLARADLVRWVKA